MQDGWEVDLSLGGTDEWSYAITRIDLTEKGMRVVIRERFAGTVEQYVPLDNQRFNLGKEFTDRDSPPRSLWRFGVEYPDGTRTTTVDYEWIRKTGFHRHPDLVIVELGSEGHITDRPRNFWFAPTPPLTGTLTFAIEWPLVELQFSTVTIDMATLSRSPRSPAPQPQGGLLIQRVEPPD
jgi:hypothetical protein